MKKNIYVLRDLEIKREGNTIKIENKKLPLSIIDNVFIFSKAKITRSAQNLLLKHSKAIFYLNGKYELVGILTSPFFVSDTRFRVFQYKNENNIELAKVIVNKKIKAIEEFIDKKLDDFKNRLNEAKKLNEVLGVEGSVSVLMFEKFKKEIEKLGIKEFKKREYRPVRDRVNGLLSFLYSLYYAYLFSEVISIGFDPYFGFLHKKRGKHAVFVSDMMEEARVYLTRLVIFILKEIYPDGFDGLYLNNEARKFVIKEFDEFILSYENSLLKKFKNISLNDTI